MEQEASLEQRKELQKREIQDEQAHFRKQFSASSSFFSSSSSLARQGDSSGPNQHSNQTMNGSSQSKEEHVEPDMSNEGLPEGFFDDEEEQAVVEKKLGQASKRKEEEEEEVKEGEEGDEEGGVWSEFKAFAEGVNEGVVVDEEEEEEEEDDEENESARSKEEKLNRTSRLLHRVYGSIMSEEDRRELADVSGGDLAEENVEDVVADIVMRTEKEKRREREEEEEGGKKNKRRRKKGGEHGWLSKSWV